VKIRIDEKFRPKSSIGLPVTEPTKSIDLYYERNSYGSSMMSKFSEMSKVKMSQMMERLN
jgi:hypothetical protein